MLSNKDDYQFEIDNVMDNAGIELEKAMRYFEYVTSKVVSFGLISQDNHENSLTCSTSSTKEYVKCEPVEDVLHSNQENSRNDISLKLITADTTIDDVEEGEIIEDATCRKRKAPTPDINTSVKKSRPSNVALNITTEEEKLVLPTIFFEGFAANEYYNCSRYYALMLIEGEYVNHFLESFETYLEATENKEHWYLLLKSCFEKAQEEIYAWFKEHVHQDLPLSNIKRRIQKQYGYENPMVQTAVVHRINHPQSADQDFSLYYEIYRRAARGFQHVDKGTIFGADYLIQNFIEGVYYNKVSLALYDLLRTLFFTKKRDQTLPFSEREHLTNGKRYTDVPRSWVEFEMLIDSEMQFLLMCEQTDKQSMNETTTTL